MTSQRRRLWSALAGLVSVAAGFAIAALGAVFVASQSSPLFAVGSLVIDLAPSWVKDLVIALFGTNDKIFLLALLGVVLALVAAAAGMLESRVPPWGVVVLVLLGAVGVLAVTTRAQSVPLWAVPSAVGMLGACVLLRVLVRRLRDWSLETPPTPDDPEGARATTSRRSFLVLLGTTAAAAVIVGIGSRIANAASAAVDTVREAITLPKPAKAAAPVPDGASLDIDGLSPLVTPNDDFYRIDTALQVPSIDPADWRLRITGMVEEEIEITFDELLALPLTETMVTLMCVSNQVGGDLIGNAVWLGYPIRELLARARPLAGADMVLSRSIDGFTASTPLEILQEEDRDSILAVGMNGAPLPAEHGFPVRMVVPGLYGYVSATKWVTELQVTTFDDATAYWTDRGWSERGPIKIGSRIDVPTSRSPVAAGTVAIAGVAWAQHTGIQGVEVRVDGGEWMPARLSTPVSADTWVQWVLDWDATPGDHQVEVRATDTAGEVQSGDSVPVVPDGAEGWHMVPITVT
ncbi:MAG: molybdopterin-dependent oxidoreductase [Actinomycetota bacterium]